MGTATLVTKDIEGVEGVSHYRLDPPLHDWDNVAVSTHECEEHGPEGMIYAADEDGNPPLPFLLPLLTDVVRSLDHADVLAAVDYTVAPETPEVAA